MNRYEPNPEPPISSVLHAKAADLGIPITANFELTARCNFNCKMCYIHSSKGIDAEKELSAEKWIGIAEEAKSLGSLYVLLTGGEPLLRSDFAEIYTAICNMGMVVYLNTNASLITEELFDLFEKYPPFRVNVSLYGASEETYRSLCGTKHFRTVVNNIRRLKSMGINVYLTCSITRYNKDDLFEIQKLADDLGCHLKAASYLYPPSRKCDPEIGSNLARLSPLEAAEKKIEFEKIHYDEETFYSRIGGFVYSADYIINDHNDIDEGYEVLCRAGKSSLWIDWKGNLAACGMFGDERFSLKKMTLSEAWRSVNEDTVKIRLPIECRNCRYRAFCNVCAAVCRTETGSFDSVPRYVCDLQKNLYELSKLELEKRKSTSL